MFECIGRDQNFPGSDFLGREVTPSEVLFFNKKYRKVWRWQSSGNKLRHIVIKLIQTVSDYLEWDKSIDNLSGKRKVASPNCLWEVVQTIIV